MQTPLIYNSLYAESFFILNPSIHMPRLSNNSINSWLDNAIGSPIHVPLYEKSPTSDHVCPKKDVGGLSLML